MSKHNVFVVPGSIPATYPQQTVDSVQGTIANRLDDATSKADEAFNKAITYLTSLQNVMNGLNLDPLDDVSLDTDIGDIISDVLAHKPNVDDLISQINDIDDINDLTEPDMGEGSADFGLFSELVHTLNTMWLTKLAEGGTGLAESVEDAIWANFLSRQETEDARRIYELENYFAARGFTLPPGTLQGKMSELYLDISKRNTQQLNEITIEQAKLAQTNTHFLLENSYKPVVAVMSEYGERYYKNNMLCIEKYNARVGYQKLIVEAYAAKVDALSKTLTVHSSIFTGLAGLASAEIQGKLGIEELKLKEAVAKADVALKEMEYEIERARQYFALQLESAKQAAAVMAQLCASALSSVNTSATIGVQAAVETSSSVSVSSNWSDSDSYQYSETKSV